MDVWNDDQYGDALAEALKSEAQDLCRRIWEQTMVTADQNNCKTRSPSYTRSRT